MVYEAGIVVVPPPLCHRMQIAAQACAVDSNQAPSPTVVKAGAGFSAAISVLPFACAP